MNQQTELTVKVGNTSAKVVKAGQGDPLVYLHGAFGFELWPDFLESLSQNFTVYAPVHPGFTESDGIDQIDDLVDLVLYHLDLLEALDVGSAHVVGHYFGAMIAAEMTAFCSHQINRLVLASPAGLWLDDNQGTDFFATPANELRSILFNDAESDVAKSTLPEVETDEERGFQIIERVRALSTVGRRSLRMRTRARVSSSTKGTHQGSPFCAWLFRHSGTTNFG